MKKITLTLGENKIVGELESQYSDAWHVIPEGSTFANRFIKADGWVATITEDREPGWYINDQSGYAFHWDGEGWASNQKYRHWPIAPLEKSTFTRLVQS